MSMILEDRRSVPADGYVVQREIASGGGTVRLAGDVRPSDRWLLLRRNTHGE